MSTMRMGLRPSVQASYPVASYITARKSILARLRLDLLKRWIKWRCRRDPSQAGYRLLRLDDATLAALGLNQEAVRRNLLHLDGSGSRPSSEGASPDGQG